MSNHLTTEQELNLRILQEECAEVIQAISKVCRWGCASKNPFTKKSNIDALSVEIGQVLAMASRLSSLDLVNHKVSSAAYEDQHNKFADGRILSGAVIPDSAGT